MDELENSLKGSEGNPFTNVANELLKQKIDFGSTYEQIKRNITLLNNQPGSSMKIPTINFIRETCSKRFEMQNLVQCDKCREYVSNGYCEECMHSTMKNDSNFIIYIPLKQQIEFMLRKYFKDIIGFLDEKPCHDYYDDIHSGSILDNVKGAHNDSIVLSFTLNVDGGNIS